MDSQDYEPLPTEQLFRPPFKDDSWSANTPTELPEATRSTPPPQNTAPISVHQQQEPTVTTAHLPSLSDPLDAYLPWNSLVHHPASPNLTYHVPFSLRIHESSAPIGIAPVASDRVKHGHPPSLHPRLDWTSPHFNPLLALSLPTSELPRGFFHANKSFPIYDNLAQFTALSWSAGSTVGPTHSPASVPSVVAGATGPPARRLALDLQSLCTAVSTCVTATDAQMHWCAWLARVPAVHAAYHADRAHRALARTLADQADAGVVAREQRKAKVLKAREAALELRKLLHVWDLAEKDDPAVVEHPRHPQWVGANLSAWEALGMVLPGASGTDGKGAWDPIENRPAAQFGWGNAREGGSGGDDRRRSKGSGSRGLKWSHRKRIKDVR